MNNTIIIMGMHRSGSSLTARIFHELGFYLTDTPGVPDPANAEGEYENLEITQLNEQLLATGSWYDPVVVDKPDKRCKDVIEKYQKPFWGWKDNRTAFTFKAYEPYLDNVMFVITRRDKDAVVKSLDRTHRGQFPEDKRNSRYYGELYDRYYEQIDIVTQGYNRIDVHYEDLVNNKHFNEKLRHF
jgi:hypothetical protein